MSKLRSAHIEYSTIWRPRGANELHSSRDEEKSVSQGRGDYRSRKAATLLFHLFSRLTFVFTLCVSFDIGLSPSLLHLHFSAQTRAFRCSSPLSVRFVHTSSYVCLWCLFPDVSAWIDRSYNFICFSIPNVNCVHGCSGPAASPPRLKVKELESWSEILP